jgi:ribonuclease PH
MAAPARTQPPMKTLATLAETTSSLRIGSPRDRVVATVSARQPVRPKFRPKRLCWVAIRPNLDALPTPVRGQHPGALDVVAFDVCNSFMSLIPVRELRR